MTLGGIQLVDKALDFVGLNHDGAVARGELLLIVAGIVFHTLILFQRRVEFTLEGKRILVVCAATGLEKASCNYGGECKCY